MEHSNILPQVKPVSFTTNENTNLVHKELLPNLVTCYVEDNGSTITYITSDRLIELGIRHEDLYGIALKNLLTLTGTKEGMRIMDNGDGTKAISFETQDSYDSSRLLLVFGPLLDTFIEILGDPFLVAIPCRDFLLAVPPKHEGKLSAYAAQLFDSKENPITKELFLFSKKEEAFKN